MNEKDWSVSSTGDAKCFSVLMTLCGMSSWLVQVTRVPAATLAVPGLKLKLSM